MALLRKMESDKPGGVFAAIAPAVTAVTGETILDANSSVCVCVCKLSVGKANQITSIAHDSHTRLHLYDYSPASFVHPLPFCK